MDFLYDPKAQNKDNSETTGTVVTDNIPLAADEKSCLFCKFDIPLRKYSEHMKHHFQNKTQKCFKCEKIFSEWKPFQKHFSRAHKKGKNLRITCNNCDKLFSSKIAYERHQIIHARIQPSAIIEEKTKSKKANKKRKTKTNEPPAAAAITEVKPTIVQIQTTSLFACIFCKKRFDDKLSLMVHFRTACVLEKFRFYCSFCPNMIADETIENHLNRLHFNGIKPATTRRCRICSESSQRDFANWVYHIEQNHSTQFLHYDQMPIAKQCHECRTGFPCYGLEVHHCELTHGIPSIYKCNQCTASFDTEDLFGEHTELHCHSNTPMCTHCNQPFQCRLDLQLHLAGSIFMQEHIESLDNQYHSMTQCRECGWIASSETELEHHMRNHRLKLECPACKCEFYNQSKYNNHITSEHVENESRCPYCPFVSSHKEAIQAHMNEATCFPNPVECKYCDKLFSSTANLNFHRHREHTNKKIELCWLCGVSVSRSFSKHMESHIVADKKPEPGDCSSAKQIFTKKQIKMHSVKRIAPAPPKVTAGVALQSDKRYKCGECDKCFSKLCYLKRHKVQRHPMTLLDQLLAA